MVWHIFGITAALILAFNGFQEAGLLGAIIYVGIPFLIGALAGILRRYA